MRIIVVTQYFWPENFRINDLVAELVRRGNEVVVLTGRPNYPDGAVFPAYRRHPEKFGEYCGAKIVRVPLIPRGESRVGLALNYFSFAVTASLLGPWKLKGVKADVIFVCQLSPVFVGIPGAVLKAFKKIPMALWVLDLWPESLAATGVLRSRGALNTVGAVVTGIYRQCNLILAQSRNFMPEIQRRSGRQQRVIYFPSWAEQLFSSRQVCPAPEIPTRGDYFNIMFAGNIGEAQDFPAILEAATILRGKLNVRWLILGDGRMSAVVAAEIARRGLENEVIMLGRFPLDRMPAFYRHADAMLVSLRDEPVFAMTVPGKIQSYLTAGVPIIAMLNGEGADVVRQSEAGYCCAAGDSVGLVKIIGKLAALSPEERANMGKRGISFSASEFDRGLLINRLIQELEKLVRPTGRDA